MSENSVRSGESTTTLVRAPLAPARSERSRSPFRPGRRPASELTSQSAAASPAAVVKPPPDDLLAAWTSRVELERPRMPRSRDLPPRDVAIQADPQPPRPTRVRDPEHHLFEGTMSVSIGPFGDLDLVGDFVEALQAVPGVAGARIKTFDRLYVVFDVELAEPTALIAALRAQSDRGLRLLHANDVVIRLG